MLTRMRKPEVLGDACPTAGAWVWGQDDVPSWPTGQACTWAPPPAAGPCPASTDPPLRAGTGQSRTEGHEQLGLGLGSPPGAGVRGDGRSSGPVPRTSAPSGFPYKLERTLWAQPALPASEHIRANLPLAEAEGYVGLCYNGQEVPPIRTLTSQHSSFVPLPLESTCEWELCVHV